MSVKINTCVIPAAGKGSRWAPVSGYLPKEMLPLIDRPVIEWVVKEAVGSGCTEVVIVINEHKKLIQEYLSSLKDITNKAKLHFINQDVPRGIAHAILLSAPLIGDRHFSVALPDLPTIARVPVLKQLIKAHQSLSDPTHIFSFCSFPPATQYLYSECLTQSRDDKLLEIIHFCPKDPSRTPHHPGNKIRMSGRYIFTPKIFNIIDQLLESQVDGEIKDVDALKGAMDCDQQVLGLEIVGHTYDTGTPENYVRANTAFFKKHLPRAL